MLLQNRHQVLVKIARSRHSLARDLRKAAPAGVVLRWTSGYRWEPVSVELAGVKALGRLKMLAEVKVVAAAAAVAVVVGPPSVLV